MRTHFVFASCFAAAVLAACGGATPSELFSTEGATDSGTTRADTSVDTPDSSTIEPLEDAAIEPIDANVPDAIVNPPKSSITCGNTPCAIGQTCCANGERAPFNHVCKPDKGGCGDPSVIIQCDSAGDCATAPGNARICCGERVIDNGRTSYRDVTCRTSCTGTDVRFCDPSNPAASCGAQGRCGPSTILPGYNTCQ